MFIEIMIYFMKNAFEISFDTRHTKKFDIIKYENGFHSFGTGIELGIYNKRK